MCLKNIKHDCGHWQTLVYSNNMFANLLNKDRLFVSSYDPTQFKQ